MIHEDIVVVVENTGFLTAHAAVGCGELLDTAAIRSHEGRLRPELLLVTNQQSLFARLKYQ